jgi:hypothetical protein
MRRAELTEELKLLHAMDFYVCDEALRLAQEADQSTFASMSTRAAAVVITERGLEHKHQGREVPTIRTSRLIRTRMGRRMSA